jgi:hypothetical protein
MSTLNEERILTMEQFTTRFVEHMVAHPNAASLPLPAREYGESVAGAYWLNAWPHGVSPEECAEGDMRIRGILSAS